VATQLFSAARDTTNNRIRIADELDKFLASNAKNILGMESTLQAGNAGDRTLAIRQSAGSDRATIANLVSSAQVRSLMLPHLQELMEATDIDKPTGTLAAMLDRLRDYMLANAVTLNSRDMTFGTPAATGTGTGSMLRLTVDDQGFPLEGVTAEAKNWKCTEDANSGTKQKETFRLEGNTGGKDPALIRGSNIANVLLTCLDPESSADFITNPTFQSDQDTLPSAGSPVVVAATDSITGWTLSAAPSFQLDSDIIYRGIVGQDDKYSLEFLVSGTVTQVLEDEVAPDFDLNTPIYREIAVYRKNAATGTLNFRWGAALVTVSLATLVDNAWNIVRVALDATAFFRGFDETTMDVQLEVTGLAVGTVHVHDLTAGPFTAVDGSWLVAIGAQTDFLVDDEFDYTDAEGGTRGINSYWLNFRAKSSELLGRPFALPAVTAGAETWLDPA